MNTWYKLNLGNGADAFAPTREIQEACMAMLVAHGRPWPEWALFSRYDLQTDNVEMYFTPAASALALQYGATPCEKPALNKYRMGLLCGEADALRLHFPDQSVDRR